MKSRSRILAGTAISLLMAAPLGASPLSFEADETLRTQRPLILAQADCEGEECPPDQAQPLQAQPQQEQPQAEEEAPAAEPEQPEPEAIEPAPEPVPDAPVPEPEPAPPEPEPAPAPEADESGEAPPAEVQPETEVQPEPEVDLPSAEEPAPIPEPAPEAEREGREQQRRSGQERGNRQGEGQQREGRPSREAPVGERPARGEQTGREAPAEQAPAEQPSQSGDVQTEQEAAPIFDSQKEENPAEAGAAPVQPPVEQGPPPESDAAATEAAQPRRIEAVTSERGTRRERVPDEDRRREARPEGVDVLREIGDRIIMQLGNQVVVESNDRPRMTRGARDVYYEDLPRGRTRETIVRDNGVEIVTIRDRYGDVIRRSRITPDGREYVLVYAGEEEEGDRRRGWRDPGLDLPPMRLNIPRNEYILESEYVDGPDDYYDFLERPPVERVQRLYSVDEVKRSARVRDIARRVDLDTLTFETGSASISDREIERLDGVARAMERLLERNPAETFLIEGHTDAVGSDVANLALSDRRAEGVADALTNVFDIPPENLVTQGYGERYLKVKTEAAERENRRVAIRRITPLVAPVASAR